MAEKPHFLARKIQEAQRQSARPYSCPLCADASFLNENRLFEHAVTTHASNAPSSRESPAWKEFVAGASTKTKPRNVRKAAPETPADLSHSMRPNLGDDGVSRSRASSRPVSAPCRTPEKNIEDIQKLTITPNLDPASNNRASSISMASNPLKRTAGETGTTEQTSRKAKAISGRSYTPKDPDFDRKAPPHKQLFNPNLDRTSGPRKPGGFGDLPLAPSRADFRPPPHRSKRELLDKGHPTKGLPRAQHHPIVVDHPLEKHDVPSTDGTTHRNHLRNDDEDTDYDTDPELLLQPETRPISHEQLVVEVKGIYAGLVMVEAKCIDVDEKQSIAAQERDPSKQTTLAPEQWQALIALHKTLLHEHHDFFLASQHPSASSALSRLAAKYSMPARMWRHGIHAFLEVLRHRLPDSLDHMLGFIYIAYSMMALLYETVPTFEDTWIECLGDLGRYRMAIEDDDARDRDTWSGVASFWYGKAADKSPNVGRLYHHLAILAKPSSIQQLSLYTRALTCIVPFESARGSIMTLFNPVLNGKQDSTRHKPSSMEWTFVKAHALLFTGRSINDFGNCVNALLGGMLIHYISRAGPRFKEVGVVAMIANSAALFEYGTIRSNGSPRSVLRLAFEETRSQVQKEIKTDNAEALNTTEASQSEESLSPEESNSSSLMIELAASFAFGTLSVALRKPDDRNVHPMVHTSFVQILGFAGVEKAMIRLERWIPWDDIAFFLTSIATPEAITARVFASIFPKPQNGIGRPLPEDFLMRGQLWSEHYFPEEWFEKAAVDDEERVLELPSMEAPRLERILWLGMSLVAKCSHCLSYNAASRVFSTTQYAKDLPKQEIKQFLHVSSDQDSIMTDDYSEDGLSDRSPIRRAPSFESSRSDLQPPLAEPESPRKLAFTKPTTILQRKAVKGEFVEVLPKDDIEMADVVKHELSSPRPKSIKVEPEDWSTRESYEYRLSPQKFGSDHYASDPQKLKVINTLNSTEVDDNFQQ